MTPVFTRMTRRNVKSAGRRGSLDGMRSRARRAPSPARTALVGMLVLSACSPAAVSIRPEGFSGGAPYSPGLLHDGTLHVSGQMGRDPATGQYPESFEDEARRCLDNVRLVLRAAGMDLENVVSVQVFLTDVDLQQRMNDVYRSFFTSSPLPARTTVGVNRLPGGKARIEI